MIDRVFGGRYRLTERIGVGGMAEVYKASDEVLGRTVAVKVMLPHYAADPTFAARFKQEAQAAANLQSPFIVNIYDWGYEQAEGSLDGTYFIVMEYVRGTDLKTAIQQRGAINQRKVAEIGSQVCAALNVAHGYDVIHRDIKPHNLMIQPDGNTKVMDFGIARANNSNLTQTGSVLGTAYYVSPEQAQGKSLTAATDIYSLGICLYEASTGKVPFDGPDAVSIALKQVSEEPVPPRQINPGIDATFEAIILKAMAKNPAERFATAEQMRAALNDYLAGRPVANLVDTAARTQVIGAGAVVPVVKTDGMLPADGTAVLPTLGSGPAAGARRPGQNGAMRPGYQQEKGSNKKVIGIVIGIIAALLVIGIVVALLFLDPFASPPEEELVSVPSVVNMTQTVARQTLEAEDFEVVVVYEASDTVEEDLVIRQDPRAEAQAEKGSKVTIYVSGGTDKVEVPNVTNKPQREAEQLLRDANLTPEVIEKADDSVKKGNVIEQMPAAGEKVDPGAKVTVYISTGPGTIAIPNVIGMRGEDARARLVEAGFTVVFTDEEYSTGYREGTVMSQEPTGVGKKGDTIYLTLSKGPEPPAQVEVPTVLNDDVNAATSRLRDAGLFIKYDGTPTSDQWVVSQNPAAGTKVDPGSTVTVTFSDPPEPDPPTPPPTE